MSDQAWTHEKPTLPGWYWVEVDGLAQIHHLHNGHGSNAGKGLGYEVPASAWTPRRRFVVVSELRFARFYGPLEGPR